jgi:DNA processing protein
VNIQDIYLLSKIKGIGPKAIIKIYETLKAQGQTYLNPSNYERIIDGKQFSRYQKALVSTYATNQYDLLLEETTRELDSFSELDVQIISIADPGYSHLLRMISDPPPILFLKGNRQLLHERIGCAVVGTRDNTERGQIIAEKTVDFLCTEGFTVVSGLANGIDTIAHQQTLKNQGKTIAVLVDAMNIHPKANIHLAESILEQGGLLVSENPPRVPVIPQLFAKRDRIQAGLSTAVFAIETSKTGGTRHAMEQASKYKRLVYVPDYEKSGYQDTSIPQLEGLKNFYETGIAEKYTKLDYAQIASKIKEKYSVLEDK